MQNKSAIWAFTILLIIACLYQLSFSFVTSAVEDDAEELASEMVDSVRTDAKALEAMNIEGELPAAVAESLQTRFNAQILKDWNNKEVYPLIGTTYRQCKKNEINLGLDLQGGMSVTLEVAVEDMIVALSKEDQSEEFQKALQLAKEMKKGSDDDFTTLLEAAWDEVPPSESLAPIFHKRGTKGKFPREAGNGQILSTIQEEAEEAVKRTEQVLRKRIDNLGVVQPKIQRLSGSGRIIIELPGVKDTERIKKILEGTAKLEFWETYTNNQRMYNAFNEVDVLLAKRLYPNANKNEEASTVADSADSANVDPAASVAAVEEEPAPETEPQVADINEFDFESDSTVGGDSAIELSTADIDDLLETQDTLQDQNSSVDPTKNPWFAIFSPNLIPNQEVQGGYSFGRGPILGYVKESDREKFYEYIAREDVQRILPKRAKFFLSAKPTAPDAKVRFYSVYAAKVTNSDGKAPLEGDVITNAFVDQSQLGEPEVVLIMNGDGASTWAQLTGDNIDSNIAIVLDDLVYSAPTVNGAITGGRSNISGQFSPEEAEDLANILKAGKLEVESRIIESQEVGPSLGQQSVSNGLWSFIIAQILVLIYMAFYYARAGVVADIALFANMFFIIGVLASLNATLTLPGIAGIVLTIGMSVDANVLIYERIREELSAGKGLRLAIVDGYNNAYSSIIDANLTTLLTGIVLSVFGTGPIKGFATTLIIGILTSLFSAIFITRLVFEWQLQRKKTIDFATKATKGAFKNLNIAFIPRRKMFYLISGIIIAGGVASMAYKSLDYGVDFTGGRTYVLKFEQEVPDTQPLKDALASVFLDKAGNKQEPEVKSYGSSYQFQITTNYMMDSEITGSEADSTVRAALMTGTETIGNPFTVESSSKVGATIADDIQTAAIWSVLFSLAIIFLYILFRFKHWQYGLGALVAMFHDVLIVLSIFSIFHGILPFSMEIDQAFIAAILTVVGYSINDTVVVFDRIREYLGIYKRKEYNEVVNSALNSTLSRTINTSLSTFFVLLMIFLFGGAVIKGFVFALMVGVIVGTYSSLCVATPIVLDFNRKKAVDK
ncbi:MAG: protein translocase subunit SecDF [Salibacteraceae bacterium]